MPEWLSAFQAMLPPDLIGSLSVRELIISLVALLVVYMLVVIFRMKALSGRRRFDEIAAARYEQDLSLSTGKKKGKGEIEVEVSLSAPLSGAPADKSKVDDFYGAPKVEPKTRYTYEPPETPPEPDRSVTRIEQEKMTRLERELATTREELDALRSAFAQTRDAMQQEIERLKATQRVSPVYGDSLQMAMSGASAEEIAARCGIARAEAELVLSMARGAGSNDTDAAGRGNDEGKVGRSRYGSY